MGKKRIAQLLEQLQDNQQREVENAAAIFTVAQVAVNQLQPQEEPAPAMLSADTIAALPAAPVAIDVPTLKQRYGSFNACRQAAKQRGIKFRGTPTWAQLCAGFSYAEACQQLISSYVEAHPQPNLAGVSIELRLHD